MQADYVKFSRYGDKFYASLLSRFGEYRLLRRKHKTATGALEYAGKVAERIKSLKKEIRSQKSRCNRVLS